MRYTLDSMLPEQAFKRKLGGYGLATLEGGGKGGGSSTTVVNQSQQAVLDPAQRAALNAQTNFLTGTIDPAYQNAIGGATNVYNQTAPGVNAAAQNYGATAGQAQQVLGSTGQSALQTGISGLENVFGPDYVQNQLAAVLNPAQAQYQQNLANQGAQFGGAGQIGSARQALAQTQLAGSNASAQQQAAAQVMNNIASQQLSAGSTLGSLGMSGLQNAQAAGANQLAAAQAPQNLYNQYASVIFGAPASSYNANFAGTQGSTGTRSENTNSSNWNVGIGGAQGAQAIGSMAALMSDRRAKKDIKFIGQRGEHKIYTFKYITGDSNTYEGVMADDVKKYNPDAVNRGLDGFDRVNYEMLGLEMKVVE